MVIGKESEQNALTAEEVSALSRLALSSLTLDGKRVLVIIPDHTRHAPIPLFFRMLFDQIGGTVKALDYLIATGTHQPMSIERIFKHVGITEELYASKYRSIKFFNHEHDNPEALKTIGTISAGEIASLTDGLFNEPIAITVNKHIFEYDQLILISPVVPHETVGFSGGNKYFFPGIGGVDIIRTFHWLGAVITNPVINGVKDTLVRNVINRAATFLSIPRLCYCFTIDDHRVASLYIGSPEESWSRAADSSMKLHIQYVDKPYQNVLAVVPPIYEDIWVAGKAMYKLEPVVADGGEVIIYGPHIKDISFTHGEEIKKVGYHVRDYFVKQWSRFSHHSGLILAHSTNVRGIGRYEHGVEYPRITVTLATAIPEDICRSINLGYRDPRSIDVEDWKKRQGSELLVVENAGQILYRLKNSDRLPSYS